MDQELQTQKSSLVPVIIAVVITALVVGGGMYWWNSEFRAQQGNNQIVEKSDGFKKQETPSTKSILYSDAEHRFKFVINNAECKKYLQVTKSGEGPQATYTITLPLAKEWNGALMTFGVMTQNEYNGYNDQELPGKPKIELNLDNGLLLTHWDPQDIPSESDLPQGCGLWDIQRN